VRARRFLRLAIDARRFQERDSVDAEGKSISSWSSAFFQTVVLLLSLMAGGYLPVETPCHHADLLTGTIGGIGGFAVLLPMMVGRRLSPGERCFFAMKDRPSLRDRDNPMAAEQV
jgi:hypothetical protein